MAGNALRTFPLTISQREAYDRLMENGGVASLRDLCTAIIDARTKMGMTGAKIALSRLESMVDEIARKGWVIWRRDDGFAPLETANTLIVSKAATREQLAIARDERKAREESAWSRAQMHSEFLFGAVSAMLDAIPSQLLDATRAHRTNAMRNISELNASLAKVAAARYEWEELGRLLDQWLTWGE